MNGVDLYEGDAYITDGNLEEKGGRIVYLQEIGCFGREIRRKGTTAVYPLTQPVADHMIRVEL